MNLIFNVPFRAPVDCVQYFTGTSNTVNSYGWAGGQLLEKMDYRTCVRYQLGHLSPSLEITDTDIISYAVNSYGWAGGPGQSVPIPRHSQTRVKNAGLMTLET